MGQKANNSQYIHLSEVGGDLRISKHIPRQQAVQAVLDSYTNQPVAIYFKTMDGTDLIADLNGNQEVYGASAPKIVMAAFTVDCVEKGLFKWNQKFEYKEAVNETEHAYGQGGTGTIINEKKYIKRIYKSTLYITQCT